MKRMFKMKGALLFLIAIIACGTVGAANYVDEMQVLTQKAYQCATLDTVSTYVAGLKQATVSSIDSIGTYLYSLFDTWGLSSLLPDFSTMGGVMTASFVPVVLKDIEGNEFKTKSPEEIEKMEKEAKNKYLAELIDFQTKNAARLEKELSEKGKSEADVAEMKKQIKELTDERIKTLTKALEDQGTEMKNLLDQINDQTKKAPESLKVAILKSLKDNEKEIENFRDQGKGAKLKFDVEYELFSKANQDASDITSGTDFAFMEPGVGQIPTRRAFMRQLFRTVNTNKEYIKYNDQETIVRDAKNVAGCATSTHNSKVTWQVRTLQITKVRDFVDVCIDMMDDYDFVEGEIRNLVDTDVQLKSDEGLLLGDGVYPNVVGVDSVASTFVAGDYAAKVQDANLIDLIHVAACQISDFGQNNAFTANVALLNPTDKCLMELLKDNDGRYLLPNWITEDGTNVGPVQVITNQLVPTNEAYVFDTTKGVIYARKGITIEFGFENNDNFEREIVTVKAYERFNLRIRNVDANAFMHIDDITTAIAAIDKP